MGTENFVSAKNAFALVLTDEVKSLYESGKIDTGNFYVWLKFLLGELGLHAKQFRSDIVTIENYEGYMPEDFDFESESPINSIHSVWVANLDGEESLVQNRTVLSKSWTYYIENIFGKINSDCQEPIGFCVPEEQKVTRNIYFNDSYFKEVYYKQGLVKYRARLSNKNFSKNPSSRVFSKYSYDFKNQKLITDMEDGHFFIEYYATPEVDGDILIPNEIKFISVLTKFLAFRSFRFAYYNQLGDFEQRMRLSESEFKKEFQEYRFDKRLPTFKKLMEIKQKERRWFKTNHTFSYDNQAITRKFV